MKKQVYFFTFFLFFSFCSLYAAPSLKIQGENYGIAALEQGNKVFFNRTFVLNSVIPADYAGWKFTRINANSTYLPGPLPAIQVKPDADGFIFAMVSNVESPAICEKWAADNDWTLVPDQKLFYGVGDMQAFFFYKKACTKDQWINIVQPSVFSGAVIIAPDIKEELNTVPAIPVSIEAVGYMDTDVLSTGVLAYSNRSYVFSGIDTSLKGLQFTRYNGGVPPVIDVTALESGDLYIAVSEDDRSYDPLANGWTEVAGLEFSYNDPNNTVFSVYKKNVTQGDIVKIKATGWQGVLVLAPQIDFSATTIFLPPPGVVIHNSKANTGKYVGSPSIVVLDDGTYLASHDYFGGIISYAFIYKSTDKGETWEQIAEINPMNWGKLFTHKGDVYFMGVEPRGTMGYGHCVILKSTDGGYTWTKPVNKKNGLLLEGYYHTAPTPVVFHEGKIWKAMEDQGQVGGWGDFSAFMMSIDEDADLLDADNWTVTNKMKFNPSHLNGATAWLEGNAVVARDNTVKNVLRLHYQPDDKVGIMEVSADGKAISFDPVTGFATFPGSCKKFTIQYDTVSDRYWTLSNFVLEPDRNSDNGGTRNTVVLAWSEDLYNWNVKDTLLHHPDISHHGFQYVDWLFDGDDIIAVSRTAWEDETGVAHRQHDANYLTFHRFKNFRFEKGNATTGIAVKTWYKGLKSAIALTFDDGFKAHYEYAFPVLEEYGVKGTFFVNSANIVNKNQPPVQRYGFWDDFKKIAENGHEVASHSLTHANLTSMGYDGLLNELKKDKDNIETNVGKPCLTHAYPFCLHNDEVNTVASSLFIAGRECGNLHNNASLKNNEWFNVNSDLLTWTYPRSLDNENASITNFRRKIQNELIATKKFGVACIHEVLPFNLLSTSDTYEIATTEWLTGICEFLKEKESAGDIWPTTFANIVRYAQERNNLRSLKTVISDDELKYEFTTWLDTAIFNHPLSIQIETPDNWDKVICEIWEEERIISSKEYSTNNEKINTDIIPDRQYVILKKLTNVMPPAGMAVTKINKMTCYPNPVKNKLYVHMDPVARQGMCKVYNGSGMCVLQKVLPSSCDNPYQIDVEELVPGIYIIVIENEDSIYSSKFHKEA